MSKGKKKQKRKEFFPVQVGIIIHAQPTSLHSIQNIQKMIKYFKQMKTNVQAENPFRLKETI